jgi:hypothetical protein
MAAGYAPRAEPMLTQRQRWSDVEPMTGIEPAYSLGSRFWVRTGILNRQLRVPIESLIFPAQVWFWYICQTDAVQGAVWLRFGRVGGTEQVLNQPIHNVAERPAVATGPGDRRFLLPNRFVRSAWALTPTGTPAGRRPDPGPPRRKDGDAQVRDPRFRVGRAPNSWFGGGLQSMITFPDAGVFSMIATAG